MSEVRKKASHCVGQEDLTVSSTAIGFQTYNPSRPPDEVFCQVTGAQISERTDGSNPTAGNFSLWDIGDSFLITGGKDIVNFKAIRTGSVDAKVRAKFFNYFD